MIVLILKNFPVLVVSFQAGSILARGTIAQECELTHNRIT
nr:MAG TPA: hypothetical protein [Caudoviricetes sp.]